MALPPLHLLIGAAAAEGVRGERIAPWKAWGIGAFVAVVPDAGSALFMAVGQGVAQHGLYSHTLVATVAVALGVGALAGRRWGLIVGSAYASHLLVDLLRAGSKTSVYLAWPLSAEPLAPIAPLFAVIPFEWEEGLFPELYGPDPIGTLIRQTLVGFAVFLAVVGVSFVARRRFGRTIPARAGGSNDHC